MQAYFLNTKVIEIMKNLHQVDFKCLQIFVGVVRCGGFTAAESLLNISCSSISKAIADLEVRLGVTLCRRGRAGFELTEEGEKLYQSAVKLFAAVGTYVDEVAHLDRQVQRVFRVATVDNTTGDATCPLVKALTELQQQEPALLVDMKIMTPNDITLALLRGELDVAVTLNHHKVDGLHTEELYREAVAPYVSVKHKELWGSEPLALDDISNIRLTTYTHREPGPLMVGGERHQFYFCPQLEGVLILIMMGNHVGLLPRFYAQRWVDSGEIKEVPVPELCFDSPIVVQNKVDGMNQDLADRLMGLMRSYQ